MGWAKKNLSESDREAIARSLFAVSEERNGWLNGSCPLHDDTNPSFGYHVADDVYHCHTSCTEDGDLVDLFCRVNSLDSKAGFTEFKKRFGGGGTNPPAKEKRVAGTGAKVLRTEKGKSVDLSVMRDGYRNFPPLPDETLVRLEKERGWSRQTIKDLGIRLQTQYWDKKTGTLKATVKKFARIAIPIHEGGELMNVRLYSLDDKTNKIMSFGVGVGENRLFPEPPDPAKASGLVWLCEGESDTVCARSHGLEAYTQTGKRKKWPTEQVEKFRGRDVVIAYDCDQAGVKYAQGAAKSLLDVAASIRVIDWPGIMKVNGEIPEDHGQDLTDFFVKHGKTVGDLEALLPAANSVDNENTVYLGALAFFGATITGRFGYQPMLLAEQLLRDNELLYDKMGSGYLYRWNGKVWQVWSEEYLKKQCIDYLGREATPSRINDAVHLVLSMVLMPADRKMNDQASWLCLQNGMFNIDTYEMSPHDKKHYATIILPIEFHPDNPQLCRRWQEFLLETVKTPEAIAQLQEFFGYCLTREVRYETFAILIGDGGDGKSTTLKILRAMVGEENCSALALDGLEDQFQRSALFNKQVNLASEVSGKPMESEFLKRFVSGDDVTAAFKHRDSFSFKPFAKFIFALNKMPKVLDTSDGLYRRMLPIWFKEQFLPGDPRRDPHLDNKLLTELSGIFAWSLLGLSNLRKRGAFNVDLDETIQLMEEYRRMNSPVHAFVHDCLVEQKPGEPTQEIEKSKLYAAFSSYCGKNGYGRHHAENFWKELGQVLKHIKRVRKRVGEERIRVISGIKFKVDVKFGNDAGE